MKTTFLRGLALVALALSLAALPAAAQQERVSHLVQISLLAAAKTGPSDLADLPENTRQAIEDVRRFLPFKSYRLLDTALIRTNRGARTMLTGPDGREFQAIFSIDPQAAGELLVRSFELVEKVPLPAPPAAGSSGARAAPASPASRLSLSSSFAAEIGQTVVVGTSRLDGGDQALMVLFTAMP